MDQDRMSYDSVEERQRKTREEKESCRIAKLRAAMFEVAADDWLRDRNGQIGQELIGMMERPSDFQPRDWKDAKVILAELKNYDFSDYWTSRLRPNQEGQEIDIAQPDISRRGSSTPVTGEEGLSFLTRATQGSPRSLDSPGAAGDSEFEKLNLGNESPGVAMEESDDLDMFLERKLKYKQVQDFRAEKVREEPKVEQKKTTTKKTTTARKSVTLTCDLIKKQIDKFQADLNMDDKSVPQINKANKLLASPTAVKTVDQQLLPSRQSIAVKDCAVPLTGTLESEKAFNNQGRERPPVDRIRRRLRRTNNATDLLNHANMESEDNGTLLVGAHQKDKSKNRRKMVPGTTRPKEHTLDKPKEQLTCMSSGSTQVRRARIDSTQEQKTVDGTMVPRVITVKPKAEWDNTLEDSYEPLKNASQDMKEGKTGLESRLAVDGAKSERRGNDTHDLKEENMESKKNSANCNTSAECRIIQVKPVEDGSRQSDNKLTHETIPTPANRDVSSVPTSTIPTSADLKQTQDFNFEETNSGCPVSETENLPFSTTKTSNPDIPRSTRANGFTGGKVPKQAWTRKQYPSKPHTSVTVDLGFGIPTKVKFSSRLRNISDRFRQGLSNIGHRLRSLSCLSCLPGDSTGHQYKSIYRFH